MGGAPRRASPPSQAASGVAGDGVRAWQPRSGEDADWGQPVSRNVYTATRVHFGLSANLVGATK